MSFAPSGTEPPNSAADGPIGAESRIAEPASTAALAPSFRVGDKTYAGILKWLTLSLFAYVGTIFVVQINWIEMARGTFIPTISFNREYLASLIAVLGTTISPYLMFWQSAVLAVATLIGLILNFTKIDPIKALVWSAIINGVTAAPAMAFTFC
jgi:Mn2+/Fe2+ NRAMP family transporter